MLMNIVERAETALDGIIPVYTRTPEFAAGKAPEKYVILGIAEKGANFSEGRHNVTEYFVSLGVFTKSLDFALYERLKAAMSAGDFSYIGGGEVADDRNYPYITHYYLDFLGVAASRRG